MVELGHSFKQLCDNNGTFHVLTYLCCARHFIYVVLLPLCVYLLYISVIVSHHVAIYKSSGGTERLVCGKEFSSAPSICSSICIYSLIPIIAHKKALIKGT